VVTAEKNSPTVAHACRKRRLKWVLGAWGYNWATQSPGDLNMETWPSATASKVVEALCSSENEED
jgi:hypothetical protein